jgi:hypothetical protein
VSQYPAASPFGKMLHAAVERADRIAMRECTKTRPWSCPCACPAPIHATVRAYEAELRAAYGVP